MTETRELVGSRDAAKILGTTDRTIQRWAAAGLLTPVAKLPGPTGAYLFERSDVERLFRKQHAA